MNHCKRYSCTCNNAVVAGHCDIRDCECHTSKGEWEIRFRKVFVVEDCDGGALKGEANKAVSFIKQTHRDLLQDLLNQLPEEKEKRCIKGYADHGRCADCAFRKSHNESLHTFTSLIKSKIEKI